MNEDKKKHRQKIIIENNKNLENVDKTHTKTCSLCNIEKELNQFSICKGNKSGFYSCLICSRKKDNTRKKITKEYNNTDTKKCNQCNKTKCVLKNFSLKNGTNDGYSNICKECIGIYRKNNAKIFYEKKKEKLNTNLQFKMSENIRARIRTALGDKKVIKPKTEKLIGCTLKEFIKHLHTRFYDIISLENYGDVWHLDHIIPCDWFDLTDIKQIKACCHYTNLQPLLIRHNAIKYNKLYWYILKLVIKLHF